MSAEFTFDSARYGDGKIGDAIGLALDGESVIVAADLGWLAACNLETQEELWSTKLVDRVAYLGSSTVLEADGTLTGKLRGAHAPVWACTDVLVRGGRLYVGLSSFELEPTSYLFCVSTQDGSVLWRRELPGYLAEAGNTGYPKLVGGLLVVPSGGEDGVAALDAATGEIISAIGTDSPVHMGFTEDPDDPEVLYVQSRAGTLYRLSFSDAGMSSVYTAELVEAGKALASGARPLLHDGVLYVQVPTAGEDEPALSSEPDTSQGEIALVDAASMEVIERREARELEATPVAAGGRFCYIGRDGLYVAPLDFESHNDFTHANDDVSRLPDVWDQRIIAQDDALYLLSGNTSRIRLYALAASR